MAIILQEPLRALFYAPFYAAFELGAYDKEGLEVRLVSAPSPEAAPNSLFQGAADVAWGGPMRVNQVYDQHGDCDLVCFGEVVTRDPFFIIGRTARPNFRLPVLAAVRLATVSEVPTPWLCLQDDLRRLTVSLELVDRIGDWTMEENVAAFRRGDIEAVQLPQPMAEELIASGAGHLWYAAASRGPCSYTTFYTRRATLAAKRDEMLRLLRGLYRTQSWLHRQPPEALADVVAGYFPGVPQPLLCAAVARYRALGVWGRDPILPRDGYERLRNALLSSGFVKGMPYEVAVDNSLAEQVVAESPLSLYPSH